MGGAAGGEEGVWGEASWWRLLQERPAERPATRRVARRREAVARLEAPSLLQDCGHHQAPEQSIEGALPAATHHFNVLEARHDQRLEQLAADAAGSHRQHPGILHLQQRGPVRLSQARLRGTQHGRITCGWLMGGPYPVG